MTAISSVTGGLGAALKVTAEEVAVCARASDGLLAAAKTAAVAKTKSAADTITRINFARAFIILDSILSFRFIRFSGCYTRGQIGKTSELCPPGQYRAHRTPEPGRRPRPRPRRPRLVPRAPRLAGRPPPPPWSR